MNHESYHVILLLCIPLAITFLVMGMFKHVFLVFAIPLIIVSVVLMRNWIKKMELESYENM